jgi:hypothetical protein
MRVALLLTLALLAFAAPVALPSVAASAGHCTPTLDFFQACVDATDQDCPATVKFGGERACVP